MRLRKLELEDQPWFPETIKEGMTDYLRFLFHHLNLYQPVIPVLHDAVSSAGATQVIDLCSGSGGAIENIALAFKHDYHREIRFVLTDLYPRPEAFRFLAGKYKHITFEPNPVDAARVPQHLTGFRTIFSGIHHFEPDQVEAVLKNAVEAKEGIAIFDGGNKSVWMILLILVFHPIAMFLTTPFFKPFRWSRLLFTYIIPIIPLGAVWDGIISIINLYTPAKLLAIATKVSKEYSWQAGKLTNKFGMKISFLVGVPANKH